jgi:hypothetical protein
MVWCVPSTDVTSPCVTPSWKQKQTFTSDATVSGKPAANLKVEYKHGGVSVDKLTVGTDKKIVGEFTFSEALKSTDVTFKCVVFSGGSL